MIAFIRPVVRTEKHRVSHATFHSQLSYHPQRERGMLSYPGMSMPYLSPQSPLRVTQ